MSSAADEIDGIDFGASKSMRYHAYRRAFFEKFDRLTKVFSALAGAGALLAFIGDNALVSKIAASLVAVLSSLDLVINFAGSARKHDDLYRSFCNLCQDVAMITEPDDQDVAKLRRRRLQIEADEPTALDLLERRCAREEALARGRQLHPQWDLTKWQIVLSQFCVWPFCVWTR
jgi:hypothetical protein